MRLVGSNPTAPTMKLRYIILALKEQLPVRRMIRNLRTGNIFGLFHRRSHYRSDGTEKVGYVKRSSAENAKSQMQKKTGKYFSLYRCIFCGNYHVGRKRYEEAKMNDGNT